MISGLQDFRESVFRLTADDTGFASKAIAVFNYQYSGNKLYRDFIDSLGRANPLITSPEEIPFMPVEFFRNHKVITGGQNEEIVFESSGTTGTTTSRHFVSDVELYVKSFSSAFRMFYGYPEDFLILALLPSYLERSSSSLIFMAEHLIRESKNKRSGFYRNNVEELLNVIQKAQEKKEKILLLGVSYALLDLAEKYAPDLSRVIVMETGGMKGRRKEITRRELHQLLKEKFRLSHIHSEYGMTELLSQAYSKGDGIFYCPPWMKILIRDPQDPLEIYDKPGITGGINIIDLANINSCSFIATGDLGKVHEDGGFEVLGRFDNSDIRGCNLMAE